MRVLKDNAKLNTDAFDSGSWMQTWYIDIVLKNLSILMIVLCLLLARNPSWLERIGTDAHQESLFMSLLQTVFSTALILCPTCLGNLLVKDHKRETVPADVTEHTFVRRGLRSRPNNRR